MKDLLLASIFIMSFTHVHCQIDSAFLFDTHTPYGALDIRLSRGEGHFYYLKENSTFSFREDQDGPTNTYLKMTAWDSGPYGEGHMRERSDSADRFVMNYRLLVPQQYDAALTNGYPLVVVLHGYLERGNCAGTDCYHADASYSPDANIPPAPTDAAHALLNNDYNLVHAGSNYLAAHQRNGARLPNDASRPPDAFPGFVLFPQNLNGWDAAASEDVIRLIRLLQKRYNIDDDRIYINGISHGGHGAYEVMKRAPWMFAAAVMFSPADDGSIVSQRMTSAISRIPLWIFQGALDQNPKQVDTERYISSFRTSGAVVRYTLYDNIGHGTWNKALSEPDFFTWMLSNKRTDIHVFAGNNIVCATSGSGTALSIPAGFNAYEWEHNGNLIDGANKSTLYAVAPGDYRARFLKVVGPVPRWSNWSQVVQLEEKNPPKAQVSQVGTLLLPDLNGNQQAVLEAASGHAFYYWRNGHTEFTFGSAEDTLERITLGPDSGNAAISLTVAGYDHCESSPSAPKYVFFNDTAPVTLASPFNLTATSVSPSEINLSWSDTTATENGFEVWRNRTDGINSSLWVMAGLASRDASGFSDKGVAPSSTYAYKVRAINDSERSEYVPGDILTVTTAPDTEPPAAPEKLSAAKSGVKGIRVTWQPATDNASVHRYIVYYNGDTTSTTDTTHVLSGLALNTIYNLEVRAVDGAGNASPASDLAQSDTFLSGVYYTHSTGAWEMLGDIDWAVQEFTGVVDNFTLAPRTQEDFFNFMFDGYLSISRAGVYQFRMTSDDGSSLSLNDTLLIENDGVHNMHTITGPIQILSRGPQRLTVRYFDYVMSDTLLIEYKGPDTGREWTKIPPEVLTSEVITAVHEPSMEAFDFVVFPNPATPGNINIRLYARGREPLTIDVSDMTGRKMYSRHNVDSQELLQVEGLHDIEPGMYVISIQQGGRILQRKVVIR